MEATGQEKIGTKSNVLLYETFVLMYDSLVSFPFQIEMESFVMNFRLGILLMEVRDELRQQNLISSQELTIQSESETKDKNASQKRVRFADENESILFDDIQDNENQQSSDQNDEENEEDNGNEDEEDLTTIQNINNQNTNEEGTKNFSTQSNFFDCLFQFRNQNIEFLH
jgi:hypothetical protein